MKKLVLTVFGLTQLLVVNETFAQKSARGLHSKQQFRKLSGQLSQGILNAQTEAQLRNKGGDQPLSMQRRIIEQEFYIDDMQEPLEHTTYGYVGDQYGLQFNRTFLFGFPQAINGTRVNELFFSYDFFSGMEGFFNDELSGFSSFYHPYNVGINVLADTIAVYKEDELAMKFTAERNTDLTVRGLLTEENYIDPFFTKTENVYTNNRISEIITYYGDAVSTLELSEKRKITYNTANDKVASDTIFYYWNGNVEGYEFFEYSYDANGKLIKLKYIDPDPIEDSATVSFSYYSSGLLKDATVHNYANGVATENLKDSVGYNSDGFVNYRTNKINDEGDVFGATFHALFDGNDRLDSVSIAVLSEGVNELMMTGKYHYSTDDNPDSLSIYNPETPGEVGGKLVFHYQPFNTTNTKTLAKNKDGFNIYPNPVAGQSFGLFCKNELKNKNAQITVMDIKGSKIFSTAQPLMKGNNAINIPATLAPGNYFVEIIADQSVFTQKILKL